MASRCDQRVAIGELKIDLSLAKRSGVPHFIRFREHRQQRLRFGDLRHFRGRRKAFERGDENAVGVDGSRG